VFLFLIAAIPTDQAARQTLDPVISSACLDVQSDQIVLPVALGNGLKQKAEQHFLPIDA
jgi:hypothetical protein